AGWSGPQLRLSYTQRITNQPSRWSNGFCAASGRGGGGVFGSASVGSARVTRATNLSMLSRILSFCKSSSDDFPVKTTSDVSPAEAISFDTVTPAIGNKKGGHPPDSVRS